MKNIKIEEKANLDNTVYHTKVTFPLYLLDIYILLIDLFI